jgi:hypothetical protein
VLQVDRSGECPAKEPSGSTRNYDLSHPAQDASPGAGGLGLLPRSALRVNITRRG